MQPAPVAGGGGMAAPFQENVDFSIQIPERLCLFTTNKIPQTAGMATQCKVPVGAVIRPLAPAACEEDEVDVVQPGNAGIIRCKRCRTYINAFVTWLENGRRWRCNICAQLNDCPSTYFCHLDEQYHRRDRLQRPELSKGVVEFVAPTEYMVRPPQEPSYFFVLDVSATAVRSGMLHSAASAIRQSLDDLPGRGRTKVGFITYDNSVHYYNLAPDLSSPQMMVVSDLKELFVPLPEHLLVNLKESRGVVETFLENLPDMFAKNPVVSQSCLGPALKAAFTVVKSIGGKMCVFQTIQPNLGDGSLKPRENHALMGTPNEVKLLRPDISWYKDTAVEFSRQQISVDMYLFPYQYMDLAALGELPRYTAGNLHSYASFNHDKDGPRFEAELNKNLTQTTAFEAVMRIRCTKGMRITNFYGNFYIRGTDLLALPNCNTDSVFGFDLAHDEQNMSSSVVTVQAALLYTSSDGERRIRVMTQALPVTSLTTELMSSVNTDAVCNLMSKQALELCYKTTLDNARMRLQQTCVDMMRAAKGGDKRTVSGYSVPPGPQGQSDGEEKPIPENLELLPLNTLALMKNVAFRGGTDVHPDERTQSHHLLNTMWVDKSRSFIYPRMFAIHDMEDAAGLPIEVNPDDESSDHFAGRENILLPESVNLSVERLTSDGIFLLDNGVEMNLWVGRSADPILLQALFGTNSLENVDMSHIKLNTSGDDFAIRLGSIMQALCEDDADPFVISPKLNIIREGDARMEARFFWYLVEDRASFQGGTYSYAEFMEFVKNPGGAGGMGRGPPGSMPPPHAPQQGMAPPGPSGPPSNYGPPQAPPPPMQQGPPGSMPSQQHAMPPPPPPMGMQHAPPQQHQGVQHAMPPPPSGPRLPPQQGPPSGGYPVQHHQGPPSGGYSQQQQGMQHAMPAPQQGPPSGGYPVQHQQGPPSGGYAPPPGHRPPAPGAPPQRGMPPPPPQYR
jgi:protein transport protein SEC24